VDDQESHGLGQQADRQREQVRGAQDAEIDSSVHLVVAKHSDEVQLEAERDQERHERGYHGDCGEDAKPTRPQLSRQQDAHYRSRPERGRAGKT